MSVLSGSVSRSTASCFFFSSRRRHTRCALVTGVQTCALPLLSAPTGLNRSWQRREQSRLANSTGLIVIGEIAPEPRGFRRGLVAEHGPTRKRASRLMRSDRTLAPRGGRALLAPPARLQPRRLTSIDQNPNTTA